MDYPWLIFDGDFIAHRAYFARMDIPFGFLREVITQQNLHATPKIAFCFDKGKSLRQKSYGLYKAKTMNNEWDRERKQDIHKNIHLMRDEILPEIGYKNVFSQEGYEADDMIASICHHLPKGERAIIVSADQDLYQLLEHGKVEIWEVAKKQMMTEHLFQLKWGIPPQKWVDVKAIAGCSSDNVIGVPGVGEKRAALFLQDKLRSTSQAYQAIIQHDDEIERNLKLVKLPYPGTNVLTDLTKDVISRNQWQKTIQKLGLYFDEGVW